MASGREPPKTKKNEKKHIKLEVFYVFEIFQKLAKRRAGNHQKRKKNEKKWKKTGKKTKKTRKKLEVFYVFLIFQTLAKNRQFWWPPRFSGGGGPGITKKETNRKKKRKNMKTKWKKREEKRKKHEKNSVFYVFCIFQKWAKNRPFWWPPRLSGGRAGNPPKWKLWGAFPYKNLWGKLWGCQKLQNGIFGKPQQIWWWFWWCFWW